MSASGAAGLSALRGVLVLCTAIMVTTPGREAAAAIATAVSAGEDRTCSVTDTDGLRCWGGPATGDGTDALRRFPVEIAALAGRTASVDVGGDHACAVTTSGGVECWGVNLAGQIGIPPSPIVLAPTDVAGLAGTASAVAAGHDHTCVLLDSGDVQCWGGNGHGQLGDGTTDDSSAPVSVVGLGGPATAIVARTFSTCAVTAAGGVKCWGTIVGSPTPGDHAGLTTGIADVTFGAQHACVLTTAGGVACFGQNDAGQLGDGTNTPSATPVGVTGLGSGVIAIDGDGSRTCALTAAGGVKCWGRNDEGQIGDGTRLDRNAPVDAAGLASGVIGIATGPDHACATKSDGALLCWGNGFAGATGTGWWYAYQTRPANVVDFGPPVCAIVDPGQVFASRPTPRLVVKQGKYEVDLAMTASVEFALPPGVSFGDLDPEGEGMRLQIRDQTGVVRVDVRLFGGAYDPAARLGWQRNGSGSAWTFRANGNVVPYGVSRVQIADRDRGAPGGRVRVTLRAKAGFYPVDDLNDPVELTVILGDDASAAAGRCGRSAYAVGQCTENEPGTVLKCR